MFGYLAWKASMAWLVPSTRASPPHQLTRSVTSPELSVGPVSVVPPAPVEEADGGFCVPQAASPSAATRETAAIAKLRLDSTVERMALPFCRYYCWLSFGARGAERACRIATTTIF